MYLPFYGLREKPFHVTADPAFFYPSAAHREALSHLRYGIQERLGFLAITGEVGTGKTTLAKALLREAGETARTALILHPTLSPAQLLRGVLEDFGEPAPAAASRGRLLSGIERFLLEQAEQKRACLLVLDEAQALSPQALEQLRLLSNIETPREKLIQIVLLGQPELEKRLTTDPRLRALNQRIAVRFRMVPLPAEEVAPYIRHRLKVAGRETAGPDLFTGEAIAWIARHSGGTPRRINLLCDQALLAGFVREADRIDVPLMEEALGMVAPEEAPVTV
ncbi:MAG: ATPase [Candidatus Omnitrophica bacterium CG11_big_fil_rev_8_21_14_0_20_64_10]|nr:MAG: ATPase [Candidatus Omnitrophica bacterium CG11_big_fil_rev_8_21_14_0_20_64_10]